MNFLKILWRKWLSIARVIGNFQAQVILTLFYFVILFPLGILFRIFADPLGIGKKISKRSSFRKWEYSEEGLEKARKQY